MKLVLINMFVFLATTSALASEPSQGAYDKLKKMFDTAPAPASVAALIAEFPKIKGCAGSEQSSPNAIDHWSKPIKVSYTKPGFGPDFPAETITGIAFNSSPDTVSEVSANFFINYKQVLTSQGLELNTIEYYTGEYCYKDEDDFLTCDPTTKTAAATVKIRATAKNILIQGNNAYAYCWK